MKQTDFVTYAHRGASHYCPENTMMAFYAGMQMGANGIETDVRRTRDGVLVLFHDETLTRVTGAEGGVADHTYAELQELLVKKGELHDKIPTLADFLAHFAYRDITFAIELKADGIEKEVADLIFRYGVAEKTVVTAFELHRLENIKAYAPALRVGYLADAVDDALVEKLVAMGAAEICPHGRDVTPENVEKWHARGLNVRAWGIANEEIMKRVCDAGADGMTVNFPDLLLRYIAEKNQNEKQKGR
jgi:glycerophosphoryl diester phosphodiesterase